MHLIFYNYYRRCCEPPEKIDPISSNKTTLCSCRWLNWWNASSSMDNKLSIYGKKGYRNSYNCIFNPATNCIWSIGRKAITYDPKWDGGNYCGKEIPAQGLALARMVGHITYLSDASMQKKFGRVQQDEEGIDRSPNFQIDSHLNHQEDTFTKRLTLIHTICYKIRGFLRPFKELAPHRWLCWSYSKISRYSP